MKIKSYDNYSVKLSVFLFCITAYFYAMLGNGYVLLLVSVLPVALRFFLKTGKIETNMVPWFMFALFAVVSSLFSSQLEESAKFIYLLVGYFVIKVVLQREFNWWKIFLKCVYVFSLLNVLGVLLSIVFPTLMYDFATMVYSGENLEIYASFVGQEAFPGLNAQTSITAFFISVFMAFVMSDMLQNKKKVSNYILLALSIIALFLTKKRSFLIANIVAFLFLLWKSRKSKKNGNNLFVILTVGIILFALVNYTESWQGMLGKWDALDATGDVSNGRFGLWEETINIWKTAPFFGVGTNVFLNEYDLSSHNVFLQLLAEMGIFGVTAFVFVLISSWRQLSLAMKNAEALADSKAMHMISTALYFQVVFIVYSFFGNSVYGIHFMLPYVLFVALAGSYNNYVKVNRDENGNINISQHS